MTTPCLCMLHTLCLSPSPVFALTLPSSLLPCSRCAGIAAEAGLPLVGNGDVFSYSEWTSRLSSSGVTTAMIGRAALIKPWIFTGGGGRHTPTQGGRGKSCQQDAPLSCFVQP